MSWSFDIRSALMVGALLTVLVGGLMLIASRSFPPSYRTSMGWWVAACVMLPGSFVAMALRDLAPAWLTVGLSNLMVAAGFAFVAIALEIFQGRPKRRAHLWVLVVATVAASVGLRLLEASLSLRLAVVAALLGLLLASVLWNLYRSPQPGGRTQHILGAVFVISAGILFYRAGAMFLAPNLVTDLFQLTHLQVLTYAVGSALPVVASFAFLLMCTERSQRELARAAGTDYLTGAFNRRAIEEHGARAIAAARRHGMPLATLVVDIDHFKRINDELGHAAGDEALVQAVQRIRGLLRTEDVFGRLGGEEFIVLMPGTDGDSALTAAERIRENFAAETLHLDGDERRITLSIGVAALAPADRQFSQLLQRADRAMYAAKNAGRDLVMAAAVSGWNPREEDQPR
ncbi:GGDEF domain-containing protein [Arenimonas sp. MALMAid1274]|uniref:GGDEF domain-containing protein n=1 Tax=Arenimonas sp. MALMAid1274 TaxID=3411630 RepID=UPI003BA288B0